jgi:26S proteasome regulatory subunit N2
MVERIILSSASQGNQVSAIGVALDCFRKDLVEKIIAAWQNTSKMVQVLQLVGTTKGDFREEILRLCVDEIYSEAKRG